MRYLASDPNEQNFYRSIITKIKEVASELETALGEPVLSEHLYDELMQYTKNLSDLVLLRKLYISGIISSPYEVTTGPKEC